MTDNCPFCGSDDWEVEEADGDHIDVPLWYVACQECDAMGPNASCPGDAVALWSNRK